MNKNEMRIITSDEAYMIKSYMLYKTSYLEDGINFSNSSKLHDIVYYEITENSILLYLEDIVLREFKYKIVDEEVVGGLHCYFEEKEYHPLDYLTDMLYDIIKPPQYKKLAVDINGKVGKSP